MLALKPLPDLPHAAVDAWLATLPPPAAASLASALPALAPLFAAAPYLFELAQRHFDWLAEALATDADSALASVLAAIRAGGTTLEDEPQVRSTTRTWQCLRELDSPGSRRARQRGLVSFVADNNPRSS